MTSAGGDIDSGGVGGDSGPGSIVKVADDGQTTKTQQSSSEHNDDDDVWDEAMEASDEHQIETMSPPPPAATNTLDNKDNGSNEGNLLSRYVFNDNNVRKYEAFIEDRSSPDISGNQSERQVLSEQKTSGALFIITPLCQTS